MNHKSFFATATLVLLLIAGCSSAVKKGTPEGKNFTRSDYRRVADATSDPADLVNPLMGTDSNLSYSNGNTYPAVALPWGMNFWTPQTGVNGYGWAYTYRATKIRGFKQTHQPSPWINDYGVFSLMPVTGSPRANQFSRASSFRHSTESARPYYYKVTLDRYDVGVEIAPAERAAIMRFTFPADEKAYVMIDAINGKSEVKVDRDKGRVTGYTTYNNGGVPDNFKNWFVIRFDAEIVESGEGAGGGHVGFAAGRDRGEGAEVRTVTARIASSFISLEQAELSLEREIGGKSFEQVMGEARDIWNRELGRIEITGGTVEERATFYSCLYRVLLFPRKFYEIDDGGEPVYYSPYDGEVHEGYMFTDNGFWDTFRAVFPFFTIMYPEMDARIMQGLVNAYNEGGRLPSWASPGYRDCMIGAHAASLLADAYVKGIRDFDTETAWEAMVKDAEVPEPRMPALGRDGVELYNRLGYVPTGEGINENVAKTLEYAYDDFCMFRYAKAMGLPESEYRVYRERAMNYKNVFDPSANFMRGKKANGEWRENFNPVSWGGDFTEGSAWHYTWSVFHDPAGLIGLMGGPESFTGKLDSVFTTPPDSEYSYYGHKIHEIAEMEEGGMGQYAHGNQPIQHAIYLYDWAGEPWKAQARTREVLDRLYSPYPNGYCGDEDNGQTSAWYVFSALGFYPVCPGVPQYALGSPLFEEAILHLPGGKTLTIAAPGNRDGMVYIQRASINGQAFTRNYVTHEEITSGGELLFEMGPAPNRERGVSPGDAPYSMSARGDD